MRSARWWGGGVMGAAVLMGMGLATHSKAAPQRMKGAIVLFSGKAAELASNWVQQSSGKPPTWAIANGAITSHGGSIVTKRKFTDFYLHVEFKVPYMPNEHGQARGNSGIGLQGRYEIQVLDSYGIADPGTGDCGALYSQAAPLFNACKKPMEWQTYDIVFRAPRFDAEGKQTEKGRVTVLQNGLLVLNNQEINGTTGLGGNEDYSKPGPILLQDHGDLVEYRNVWIVPLPAHGALHY